MYLMTILLFSPCVKAKGKWYAKNGVYQGSFSTTSSRVKSGYGTMWWKDGTVYQGQWLNNKYNGRGQLVEGNKSSFTPCALTIKLNSHFTSGFLMGN